MDCQRSRKYGRSQRRKNLCDISGRFYVKNVTIRDTSHDLKTAKRHALNTIVSEQMLQCVLSLFCKGSLSAKPDGS
jgi:hypothetical protein